MKYRLPIAAATTAIILLAALWNWGPLGGQQSYALEQVGEAFEHSGSVSYKVTTLGWQGQPWPDPYVRAIHRVEPGRMRVEGPNEIQLHDEQAGRLTVLRTPERKVVIRPLYPTAQKESGSSDSFSERLKVAAKDAREKTEKTDVDGRKVIEFRWEFRGENFVVTADPTTMLPVRMEVTHGKHREQEIREVYSDFVYNEPIDESLFRIDVPAGFTVEEWKPDPNNKSYPEEDAEQLIVSPGRFGPVVAGMKEAEIVQRLGAPDWITRRKIKLPAPSPDVQVADSENEEVTLEYDSRGFKLTLLPSGDLHVACYSQLANGPLVRDFVGRTSEGIRVGDARQKVLDSYGKPDVDQPDHIHYLELGWEFYFRDNHLGFMIATKPQRLNQPGGIQTRILKDGRIIQAVPGVDIDAMLDDEGNLKEKGTLQWKSEPATDSATEPQPPAPNP